MVTGIKGVTGDELVLNNVLKELTDVEVFQVGAALSQLLEKPTQYDVSSFLVSLLVEGLPNLRELVALGPGQSA